MKNFSKKLIALLVLALVVTMLPNLSNSISASATKKAAVNVKSMTIPTGKMKSGVYWDNGDYSKGTPKAQTLKVNNKVKKATYTFSTSNKKIATVDKNGVITGLTAGKATITVKQTLNKKTTTVGTCKVTVKKSTVVPFDSLNFPVGKSARTLESAEVGYESFYILRFRNPDAKYTFTSNSKDFTLTEKKVDTGSLATYIGGKYFYEQHIDAKKAGKYTVTIKETYKKKTRTVGKVTFNILDVSVLNDVQEIPVGSAENVFTNVINTRSDMQYYFSIENYDENNMDNNVVSLESDDGYLMIVAKKPGTAKIKVTEENLDGKYIGTINVKVVEVKAESIEFGSEQYMTYVGDEDFNTSYDVEPYGVTDEVVVTSANPDILKIEYDQEEEEMKYIPVAAGETEIIVTCGDKTAKVKVTVYADEDEYYDNY